MAQNETKVIQKEGESRKDYLIRVAIVMLRENGYNCEAVFYDGTECDAFCLADDLESEFEVNVEEIEMKL